MKKTILLLSAFLSFSTAFFAQPKEGYYNTAIGKSEAGLKTALHNIIKGHTNVGYDKLWDVYKESDITSDGKVWDMYSTCTWKPGEKKCGNQSKLCDCYNREHSIPSSWFSDKSPMNSDAFHIYPTDGRVNNFRGNMPFSECDGGKQIDNDSRSLGRIGSSTFPGYSGKVFEPVDEYKGDFARTYFYFVTRYEDQMTNIGGESFNKTKYPALSSWSVNLFLKWHRQDPVSDKERNRNNAVEKFQKNRNPFIDYPELTEYIWGDKKGTVWSLSSGLDEINIEIEIIQNPVRDEIRIQTREPKLDYFIFSLSGQQIKSGRLDASKTISVPELGNGLYLLKLQNGSKKAVQKIIVSK